MTMKLSRAYAIFLRYMILLWSTPQRFFQILIWGSLDVVIFGYLTKYLGSVSSGFNVVSTILGGIILLDILTRFQQGTSTPVLEDIWSNNLINYFASPLRISEYVLGLVGSSIVTTVLATTVMLAVAYLVFGFSPLVLGTS